MFGRKRLPLDAPPLWPDDARVISGEVVTHIDDEKLYDECVRQREEFLLDRIEVIDIEKLREFIAGGVRKRDKA